MGAMKIITKKLFVVVCCFVGLHVVALDFTDQGEYMGSSNCRSCHERFYQLWSTSHHGKAMQAFSATFAKTLKPMKKPIQIGDKKFIIELNDRGGILRETLPDGTSKTYPVRHALGGRNIYFFLVPLEKGKLQVAPLAYYVHTQLWYDSTASMVRHFQSGPQDSAVDWTDRQLTFNTACHDCHVSQLDKNYDEKTDSYHTTWNEAGINCEVCHGPAEAHIREAKKAQAAGKKLTDLKLLTWHGDLNAKQRDASCSPCHAKMIPLTRDFTPGELFFNHYDLVSYEDRDFYADGRDNGENYTMTGWAANACANSGKLECIHCHTSSGRFRFKDNPNQACLPCHEKRVKNIHKHSHHPKSASITCVDCHMPKTAQAYMTRSDHSFRPPSPASSIEFGSPNACVVCHFDDNDPMWLNTIHTNKADSVWANKHVKKWYGENAQDDMLKLGRMVTAARNADWERLPEILAYFDDPSCDQAAKVALIRLLDPLNDSRKFPVMYKQCSDKSEWVRSAAAFVLRNDFSPQATSLLLAAIRDPFRTVRIRAAQALLARNLSIPPADREAFERAHKEYWNSLVIWPDRWSTYYNQGIYFNQQGKGSEALAAYKKAIALRSDVVQPLLNASLLLAQKGDLDKAYEFLKKAEKIESESPAVLFNLALVEAERGKKDQCEKYLRKTLKIQSNMPQAAYNLGILLRQNKKEEGYKWLKKAIELVPSDWSYLSGYIAFLYEEKRHSDIEAVLKQSIATKHAPPEAYFTLAGIYQRSKRVAEAVEIYKKIVANDQMPVRAIQEANQILLRLQQK